MTNSKRKPSGSDKGELDKGKKRVKNTKAGKEDVETGESFHLAQESQGPFIVRQRPALSGVATEILQETMRHVRQPQMDLVIQPTPPGFTFRLEDDYGSPTGVRNRRALHWIDPSITQTWPSYPPEDTWFEERVRPSVVPPLQGRYGDRIHLQDVSWELLPEGRV
ncbi:hypothetical protein P152DRAFT_481560 [Eremomyces bilateralis CBS 781.70]|uniref:Uncharacterized protein n=1 Tax=Eremomyces bilateralis CBS 781.70 TaxID=1392243 RepID=A0A6G1G620_9PEZI|nr:uncharacterized protein P152DRAFT_481560 [Eremomyces bilateralis CBS 781.70]KAF1813478.1 hypothetical protein P152DRAFT_481560 [Eremomyces bilateralis CBS 781.70]